MPSPCPLCGGTDSCERVHDAISSRFLAGESILSLRDDYGIANERDVVLILLSRAEREGWKKACGVCESEIQLLPLVGQSAVTMRAAAAANCHGLKERGPE